MISNLLKKEMYHEAHITRSSAGILMPKMANSGNDRRMEVIFNHFRYAKTICVVCLQWAATSKGAIGVSG